MSVAVPGATISRAEVDDAMRRRLAGIFAVLDSLTSQERTSTLLLAMIVHIDVEIEDKHHAAVARGIASALIANFEGGHADETAASGTA
jgi:hypothetical protein